MGAWWKKDKLTEQEAMTVLREIYDGARGIDDDLKTNIECLKAKEIEGIPDSLKEAIGNALTSLHEALDDLDLSEGLDQLEELVADPPEEEEEAA